MVLDGLGESLLELFDFLDPLDLVRDTLNLNCVFLEWARCLLSIGRNRMVWQRIPIMVQG